MTKSKTTLSVFSFEKKSHKKTGNDFSIKFPFVVPLGLEPRAYGLENRCSIQLSYGIKQKKLINQSENLISEEEKITN